MTVKKYANLFPTSIKILWKYVTKRQKTIKEWVAFICTVLGGIAVVIQFIPNKLPEEKTPITLNYPPLQEVGSTSLTFGEDKLNEIHLSWIAYQSELSKTSRNCFRFEFSVKNVTNILQNGAIHLVFHNPKPIHKYSEADKEAKSLLCDNPLNEFMFEDPFNRMKLKRTIFESKNDLVINYEYQNMPPNRDIKLHFYLNYNPNTILHLVKDKMEVIAKPVALHVEITTNNKVFSLGTTNIYMHLNSGAATMVATTVAYSKYFLSLSLNEANVFKRIKSYLKSFFVDINHDVNQLLLSPRFFLHATFKGEKEYLLASSEVQRNKSKAAWNILKLVNSYSHSDIIYQPEPMSYKAYVKLRTELMSTFFKNSSSGDEKNHLNYYEIGTVNFKKKKE